jgi:hypothetical protein
MVRGSIFLSKGVHVCTLFHIDAHLLLNVKVLQFM